MNFKSRYDVTKGIIEQNLLQYIENIYGTKHNTLYEAMKYSLSAGGKRFRPILHLETAKLLGGATDDFIDSACAIEYVHTYSLIHDDLPAMDNDDFRRGKLTNHKVFGEDIAILTGDGLLNSAFEILWNKVRRNPTIPIIKGTQFIAEKSGANGMIAGQVVDIQSENKEIDLDTLLYIHHKKTGALIEASILSVAYMMDVDIRRIEALKKYALHLGLAFQISDDILDVVGSFESLGKPIGSDAENHKSTFVTHYGLDQAKRMLKKNVEEAIDALNIFSDKEFLEELAKYVANRNV